MENVNVERIQLAPITHPTFTDSIIASLQQLHGHVSELMVNYLFVSDFQDLGISGVNCKTNARQR
jgi:hypothetical protein